MGSIVGPTIAGFAMSNFGTSYLFVVTGGAHVCLILFALLRLKMRPAVAQADKVAFQAKPLARASTPETAALAGDESELEADQKAYAPEETSSGQQGVQN